MGISSGGGGGGGAGLSATIEQAGSEKPGHIKGKIKGGGVMQGDC